MQPVDHPERGGFGVRAQSALDQFIENHPIDHARMDADVTLTRLMRISRDLLLVLADLRRLCVSV